MWKGKKLYCSLVSIIIYNCINQLSIYFIFHLLFILFENYMCIIYLAILYIINKLIREKCYTLIVR